MGVYSSATTKGILGKFWTKFWFRLILETLWNGYRGTSLSGMVVGKKEGRKRGEPEGGTKYEATPTFFFPSLGGVCCHWPVELQNYIPAAPHLAISGTPHREWDPWDVLIGLAAPVRTVHRARTSANSTSATLEPGSLGEFGGTHDP